MIKFDVTVAKTRPKEPREAQKKKLTRAGMPMASFKCRKGAQDVIDAREAGKVRKYGKECKEAGAEFAPMGFSTFGGIVKSARGIVALPAKLAAPSSTLSVPQLTVSIARGFQIAMMKYVARRLVDVRMRLGQLE